MTKQEQARWDEVRKGLKAVINHVFQAGHNEGANLVLNETRGKPRPIANRKELIEEFVAEVLDTRGLCVLHPEQELPKAQVLFSGLYTEESVYKQAQQDMRGWKRVI